MYSRCKVIYVNLLKESIDWLRVPWHVSESRARSGTREGKVSAHRAQRPPAAVVPGQASVPIFHLAGGKEVMTSEFTVLQSVGTSSFHLSIEQCFLSPRLVSGLLLG